MRPTHQARIESAEKALEAYRQERYQGSARVRLDCLKFENGFGRLMDDGRNALRLEQILEIQGCLRINREYHVPVLVQATDWGSHIRLLPCDTEPFPELIVPLNTSLRALGHGNVIAAARKKLYGENRWWVVDVYVEDPSKLSLKSFRVSACVLLPVHLLSISRQMSNHKDKLSIPISSARSGSIFQTKADRRTG
ncbi:hypothetical protein BDQ94DRAFT_43141 [Aspergillus welwitschiae]|uniref:Uncharacterized protein n=1 Tax=Aspergillus welwitschiae TaxID=1341132 RepID=A0A3F3PHQ0_9EURO|nr:hypothetical protein BDQ94DRAFT_43141 [Aspergillus welwitschiae]RDH26202.1 hypothetical protein BDQ94DRAFT_43141 [Aspergillus welwitschiae]